MRERASKTYRHVPITPRLRKHLAGGEGFIFPRCDARGWCRMLERATKDFPEFGNGKLWHLLGSTFAVRRARAGATVWELMAPIGHTNPQTTMRYINLAGVST